MRCSRNGFCVLGGMFAQSVTGVVVGLYGASYETGYEAGKVLVVAIVCPDALRLG